ncbi:hypothetical protein AM593_07149, partial [Mytilus galloprovincialis]
SIGVHVKVVCLCKIGENHFRNAHLDYVRQNRHQYPDTKDANLTRYSKSVLNEVRNYMERSELDDVNALDDQADVHSNISKKAMWNFSNLMIAIFGYRRGIELLDYGCYCGFGGAGTPVDGIDRCCQAHDKCYGDEEDWWCRTKWTHYNYKILNQRTVDCKDSHGSCKYRVCRCDKNHVR